MSSAHYCGVASLGSLTDCRTPSDHMSSLNILVSIQFPESDIVFRTLRSCSVILYDAAASETSFRYH
jgi:hypothetical protein